MNTIGLRHDLGAFDLITWTSTYIYSMPFTGGMTPACTNRVLKTTIIPGESS